VIERQAQALLEVTTVRPLAAAFAGMKTTSKAPQKKDNLSAAS
jgi:hypothetical protein